MTIYINMKAAGKRKAILEQVPYEISEDVTTLRDFLTELVRIEVENYNKKGTNVQMIPYLTKEEIEGQALVGKVGFDRVYSEKQADAAKAVVNALQCFEDGLVRVFQNETELQTLDTPVELHKEDCFTLIRLTFLAGRLW